MNTKSQDISKGDIKYNHFPPGHIMNKRKYLLNNNFKIRKYLMEEGNSPEQQRGVSGDERSFAQYTLSV